MQSHVSEENLDTHVPVLVEEILSFSPQSTQTFLDCTFGRGGHTLALLKKFPQLKIYALDQDEEAIEYGKSLKSIPKDQIQFFHSSFHQMPETILKKSFDVILMDLGASSPQLNKASRGFSFYQDGSLDMRMDQRQSQTASEIINGFSKNDLIDLFKTYGEIQNPYNVVESLFKKRKNNKIKTTKELISIILEHHSWNPTCRHPATPYFLALRMKVNNELDGLELSLPLLVPFLKLGGRFMVISFHSLEDRIVKQAFKSFVKKDLGKLVNKKVIRSSAIERNQNIKSRSAKLRVFEKM